MHLGLTSRAGLYIKQHAESIDFRSSLSRGKPKEITTVCGEVDAALLAFAELHMDLRLRSAPE
jgi:hypothetical protein